MWFDNVASLTIKYQYAVQADLRGVGMWTADSVDYAHTVHAQKQRQEMWTALPDYK